MSILIKKPVISEKSIQLGSQSKYTFVVDKRSNSPEIKKSVEQLFKVKVARVNIVNVSGKPKRRGRITSRRADIKKAIITLKPGQTIKLFEEQNVS